MIKLGILLLIVGSIFSSDFYSDIHNISASDYYRQQKLQAERDRREVSRKTQEYINQSRGYSNQNRGYSNSYEDRNYYNSNQNRFYNSRAIELENDKAYFEKQYYMQMQEYEYQQQEYNKLLKIIQNNPQHFSISESFDPRFDRSPRSVGAFVRCVAVVAGACTKAYRFFSKSKKAVKVLKKANEAKTKVNKAIKNVKKIEKKIKVKESKPFGKKSAKEIDEMFRKKGFESRGPDPINGKGGYVNPKTGRSYHIDPKDYGKFREPNHVDVNRLRDYKGNLDKRKFNYKE